MPGTWKKLASSPNFSTSTMLLLTDGSVMCQQSGGVNWSKLTPDSQGNYVNGTWTPLAPMINTRLYYASAVLADGRIIVCGGEYSNAGVANGSNQQNETNRCEIYDPVTDTWTTINPPAGWTNMGDAASCLLPDGRLLVGYYTGTKTAIYDPVAATWTAGPNKGASASEETWTLLPDQTVLTVQCSSRPNAEKYVAAANAWVSAGTLPVNLVEAASLEIGPAVLMPDGRTFCVGATNHTALYTPPPIANQPGTWAAGPDFPDIAGKTIGAKDAPACLLPNGNVLLVGGPVDGTAGAYMAPTYFFEFDGTNLVRVTDPANSTGTPYQGRMLVIPTGQVLFVAETNDIYCYTPGGVPDDSWRPGITSISGAIFAGSSYTLQGRQLNGLSQAVAYGDDATMATNYPIVRLEFRNGDVFYCRTSNHSSMGVATGSALHTTEFYVPLQAPKFGNANLVVIANGIESKPFPVSIGRVRLPRLSDFEMWSWLIGSLADGPLWVWTPHGPVPVGPWGPKIAKEAAVGRKLMLEGMQILQKLGKQLVVQRQIQANSVPPALDVDAIAALGKTKKKAAVKHKAKGKKK